MIYISFFIKLNIINYLSGGGINDKSIICVFDNDSFQRCTIFIYHMELDDIDDNKYKDGYIFEGEIRKLIEPPNENEEKDDDNNDDGVYEVVKRKKNNSDNNNKKKQKINSEVINIDY